MQKDPGQKKVKREAVLAYSSVEVVSLMDWMLQVVLVPMMKLYRGVKLTTVHPIEPVEKSNIVCLTLKSVIVKSR